MNVEFLPAGKTARVEKGTELLKAVEAAGLSVRFPCGGNGRCGKCKVVFEEGAPSPTADEMDGLNETELAQGYRLGCRAKVFEDSLVYLPDTIQGAKILTAGTAREVPLNPAVTKRCVRVPEPTVDDLRSDVTRVLDAFGVERSRPMPGLPALQSLARDMREGGFEVTGVFAFGDPIAFEPGDTASECHGVAFDIGTTTIAAYLLDLNTGKQHSVAAAMNPQARVGDDVISRISYTMQNPSGLAEMQSAVLDEMNGLLDVLCHGAGVSAETIYEATIAGNTCMLHFLLGVDPRHLAMAPYVPVVSRSLYIPARELGLRINELGRVHVLPSIAGYVGADTVGVVLATDLHESGDCTLAVDIGTNGEIVLGSRDRMLACSTAAGPAFEGAHIRHGMRAAPGAIDAVWLDDGEIRFSAIGGEKASGICGSGLLDAISCLMKAGIVDPGGRIVDADKAPEEFPRLRDKLSLGEQGNEFILASADETSIGGPIAVTQKDIREIQLAKGAIAAGIQTLMEKLGVGPDDLDRIVLAGAFGNYVRKESAIRVGVIPSVPLSKVHSVGNAAGEGAKLALISLDARRDADRIAENVEYVELTTDPGFQDRLAVALMLGDDNWM